MCPMTSRGIPPAYRMTAVAAGFAVVLIAAAVAVGAPDVAGSSPKCPASETEDLFTGVCVPTVPTDVVQMTPAPLNEDPEIDGVPCTGHNSNECIGLAEESQAAGPTPSPHSTLTSSP